MKNLPGISSLLILALTSVAAAAQAGQAGVKTATHAASLITDPIQDSELVTLAGNTRPEANRNNDGGPVEEGLALDHMILQLRRSPAQERALENYIDELHNPKSPNFHHWLTAKQLGEKYGLAPADLEQITGWLGSQSFSVNSVSTSRMSIDFSGTAGQVRQAFHTEIHKLKVNGSDHIANMSDPSIPAALARAVAGIVSLNDFRPQPTYKLHSNYTFIGCGGSCWAVVPTDLATIYNLNPLYAEGFSGQGQTVAVLEATDVYSTQDWQTFRSTFGLSSYSSGSFSQIHPNSGNNCTDPGVTTNDTEAIVDAEWSSAAAPSAKIELASCADTTTTPGISIALQNLLNGSSPPSIVSISYSASESAFGAAFNAAINTLYQQAASQGVSIFASTGDYLAALSDAGYSDALDGINVNTLASTVYNVAVGGTDFSDTLAGTNSTYWSSTNGSTYGSALSYIPEMPWNDSCASQMTAQYAGYSTTYGSAGFCNSSVGTSQLLNVDGAGGGPSACATGAPHVAGIVGGSCAGYPKPSWQSVLGNPADGVRDLPDVSLFASDGLIWGHSYAFCFSDTQNGGFPCTGTPDNWSVGGGTSFAAPIMAGIQALINEATAQSWGNPDPTYYSLAKAEYGTGGSSACNSSKGNAVGSSCVFYDITQGDIDAPCAGTNNCYLPSGTYGVLSTSNSAFRIAYGTQTGWDFASGIGTVNGYNLVLGFKPDASTSTSVNLSPSAVNYQANTTVTITATIQPDSGNGAPTGTVTFYNGGSQIGTASASSGTAVLSSYSTSALNYGSYSITATYGGDSFFAGSNTGAAATLNVQYFTLSASPATVTVSSPGLSGSTTVNVTGYGNLNPQSLQFSCSGLPSESSCNFGTVSNGAVTVTVSTTAPHVLGRFFAWHPQWFYAFLFPGLLAVFLGGGKRGQRNLRVLVLLTLVAGVGLWVACGGSSGGQSQQDPGTPAGNSNVTIKASTGGASPLVNTTTIALTVQ